MREDKISAALKARAEYVKNHELAGVWLDAENELTDEEFRVYMARWLKNSESLG